MFQLIYDQKELHLSSPASRSWTAVESVCWKSHLPWYWTSLSPALALWHFQRYSHLETRPPGSFLGKLGRKSCIQTCMHCHLRASLWNFWIREGRVRKHQIQISEGKNYTRYNIALQTLAYQQKCARESIERNGVLLTFHRTWDVYLRQNGRENCDEKGEPSCHAFRFSWAAASPTIIFPERAYSNVKGSNENKRRVKRYIPLRVHPARHFSVQEHVKFPGYPKGETGKSASSLTPLLLKISTEHV